MGFHVEVVLLMLCVLFVTSRPFPSLYTPVAKRSLFHRAGFDSDFKAGRLTRAMRNAVNPAINQPKANPPVRSTARPNTKGPTDPPTPAAELSSPDAVPATSSGNQSDNIGGPTANAIFPKNPIISKIAITTDADTDPNAERATQPSPSDSIDSGIKGALRLRILSAMKPPARDETSEEMA
jgi:hypothetical protein